jgi:hypothetical protein
MARGAAAALVTNARREIDRRITLSPENSIRDAI